MPFPNLNLLTDPAFPVICVSGARRWARFVDLLDEAGDHPVAFDWPRADLVIANTEFAIGVLALIHRPERPADWRALWEGQAPADVSAEIARLAPAFNLFGDRDGAGPRFCQEFDALEGTPNPVEALFIDTPGANGQKKNADLLTHRDRFPALGLPAAAMALYALQQFAPSGGAGNRTSMRGGGPMTTLVVPEAAPGDPPPSLYRVLLLNLPLSFKGVDGALPDGELARALPWLAPTITSDGKPPREIAEADPAVHPVQAFFGMPRRIRLVAEGEGVCALTGERGPLVIGFVQKPWGMNYSYWRHPLTPYRQTRTDVPYTVKPKPGRMGFRDWVGVTMGLKEKAQQAFPAAVVKNLVTRRREVRARGYATLLHAAGWAMNNMEAERYLDALQPLHLADSEEAQDLLAGIARRFAQAAEEAVRALRGALNEAIFGGQAKSTDTGLFEEATNTFHERTEDVFHRLLADLAEGDAAVDRDARAQSWLRTLREAVLSIFDAAANRLLVQAEPNAALRITKAYETLAKALSDRGRIATGTLHLSPPAPATREGD